MDTAEHRITLYCEGTPNPLKISIALEELGLQYNVRSHRRSRATCCPVNRLPSTPLSSFFLRYIWRLWS